MNEGRMDKFTEEELKTEIKVSWEKIAIQKIQSCIPSWRKRLRTACMESGGPIDYLFM